MSDAFRRVERESWLSRLLGSVKSVVAGALLVCAALPAMWCNEGRAVTTARSLEEGQGQVVSVPSDRVDPAHEGELVHLTGQAETAGALTDPDFSVTVTAIKLLRTTEMYQWQEHEHTETRDKPGGGKESTTTYRYAKGWYEKAIDSRSFHQSSSYQNPGPVPFPSTKFVAKAVTLGAFSLSAALVDEIDQSEDLPLTPTLAAALPRQTNMRLVGAGYYRGVTPDAPNLGDVRVRFRVVRNQPVSVVARQAGDTFLPFATRAGDSLLMLSAGTRSADSMFRAARVVNRILTWSLRAAGFGFVFFGVLLVFRPIAVLGSVVPLFGSLLEAGLGLFSLALAAVLSFVTIAAAWVFYRPLFGVGLLIAAVAALLWLHRRGRTTPARGRRQAKAS